MKQAFLIVLLLLVIGVVFAADALYLNGINETTYIYRTAKDSLNSYFRDAFSFSLGYRDFTIGAKFLAELPKYSTDQNQLMHELDANRLSVKWTERFLEYEKDDLLLHGGTISESFGNGMVFRAWEDIEFDQDTRIEGFLAKYNSIIKLKALYGALPNRSQVNKYDIVYGADGEMPLMSNVYLGASALAIRTLTALNFYNQQDVFSGRINWNYDYWDGSAEYAQTSLYKNSGAGREGTGINAYTNVYLHPSLLKSLTLGAGYKYYDQFQYRLQDLKTNNYHSETLADDLPTGTDEEGIQGILEMGLTEEIAFTANYAEAWNADFKKRMNDLYSGLEWHLGKKTMLFEYGHTEKIDTEIDHWQQDIKPAISLSMPLAGYAFTVKGEYEYIEKENQNVTAWHYEPMLQVDLGLKKVSISMAAESQWKTSDDIMSGIYWANCEVKYAAFEHTDLTLFAGKQAGGKVCRNGICRYVAPFQGIKLEATTRF